MFKKILSYFDNFNFTLKTNILIFIISGGMLSIVVLSLMSTFSIKYDFDKLYEQRTKPLIKLESIKDTYTVNIQDTLYDIENKNITYTQAKEVINLALQLIQTNWREYKKAKDIKQPAIYIGDFIKKFLVTQHQYYKNETLHKSISKNIDKKMININARLHNLEIANHNKNLVKEFAKLHLEINAINIYITSLINYDLTLALNEKRDTEKVFEVIITVSMFSIVLIFLFSVILSVLLINHFKRLHKLLEAKVESKTKELVELNNSLEKRVVQEVKNNRKKDIIMFQQARLASLGEMLNNIAHQWRQPLGSITMIIQSFQTKMQLGKLTDEFIDDKVKDALFLAENMSNTLDDFINFFSPDKTKKEFSVKECIEHSFELSKYALEKAGIKTYLTMKKDIKINSFYNELSHVFLNLINNSKDALYTNINKNDRIIKVIIKQYKDDVVINFIDNGGGIPQDIAPKIFEPYYTTKYKSAGTGIGLYMSKQIIEKHMYGSIYQKNIIHKINKDKNYNCSLFIIKIPILKEENDEK
ncbi:histidine kinase/DNA gyrase B/HSP90-like ATPase [Malaciobacter marinus]|jgi:C4-dicarboxylate-specific signal transduction histidine kinase|uniref:histidine kinase n=1 Tax=Malaciobacter marinus TaxID=505249 RepID=A0AB36ZWB2_9BACT|nr:HAMP domain-containing sensor histidine kinase [Malaciobacter marinus]PPK60273.1 histidine kinase/DNA gyrase B/HSP90-like ATPase [Malaciobacter marinus]